MEAMRLPVPPLAAEGVRARPLAAGAAGTAGAAGAPLRRLVIVRLHAFGDTAIVLPLLSAISARHPDCLIEVVTGPPSADLFAARADVAAVHVLDDRAPRWARVSALVRVARALRAEPLDALLDLQRSRLSRVLRTLVSPTAWAHFDRFAPRHALFRYADAAAACGLDAGDPLFVPRTRSEVVARARALLAAAGRDADRPLVLLNPSGGWETKQWPLERWIALGRALVADGAQLLALGAGDAGARSSAVAWAVGAGALDLTGKTTPGEAMAAAAECRFAISEDSGLMHLAWAQGVPTLALFGASRAVWSRPLGGRAGGFFSEDLACGACMQPRCARGDLLCLDRVSVSAVREKAAPLLS